ncbi:hypothetical protein Tsubulata_042931 [Turnera subulata]|uniref:Gnk2-homologous domain-containing protein n=1 Tax=Turnera subulata TaxID=218843 RepID=A0A9Q0EY56_9ROSI|nr:hypothetical protein Tsubulata_042931 [Turnera subulata]
MDLPSKPFSLVSHMLILTAKFCIFLPSTVKTNTDYSALIYKKCANQAYINVSTDPSHSQTFSSAFQELVAESSHSKFFKTTGGDENIGVSALFQCRGDLASQECYNCVSKLPDLTRTHCKQASAARIQLYGCYFRYETDDHLVEETPAEHGLLHVTCGASEVAGGGFEVLRDAAFAAAEDEVVISANGFYETNYDQSVHVVAQCQGDLGDCDCGECISTAVEIAREKCGSSVSGEVYLDKCYLSYAYYPDGMPDNSYPEERHTTSRTGRTVAIFLGAVAALGVGVILLKSFKSCRKKDNI